jgi:hypothetical protein
MYNKLGQYIFQRICKDQDDLRRTRPMNMWGLYVNGNDIQKYIWEYTNYGMDWNGEESADDKWERYWDEPEGSEK